MAGHRRVWRPPPHQLPLFCLCLCVQREVYNPKAEARLQPSGGGGPRVAQAGITLHRKHELPSGGWQLVGGRGEAGCAGKVVVG